MGILSVFFYAGNFFLTHGKWIFPFPLNEIIYAVTASIIAWNYRNEFVIQTRLLALTGFLLLVSNVEYWQLVFDVPMMQQFVDSVFPDLLQLISKLSLLSFINFSNERRKIVSFNSVIMIMFLSGLLLNITWIELIAISLTIGINFKQLDLKPYLNWLILYLVLEATKLWSLMG